MSLLETASVEWKPLGLPIPNRLNILLVLTVSALAIGMLTWVSHVNSWWAALGIAILFSYAMLTNYALLHDATHDTLHQDQRVNRALGFLAGLWFPVPFSMIHFTHRSHHRFNRTDAEMFDCYYPTDNRFLKYLQWFSILSGLFWPLVPIGALLVAFVPRAIRTRLFSGASPSRGLYYMARIPDGVVRRTRYETIAMIILWSLLWWLLSWRWQMVLLCYGCFAINWSTRQYITHAFTPRDVIDGAYNLRHFRWMDWLLLHGPWDLNHHRHPDVSWVHLPSLGDGDVPRRHYVSQYFRQWRGPVPAATPAPTPIRDELLEELQEPENIPVAGHESNHDH